MKILVIHATAGAGHKKAAEAVFHGLQDKGGHDVRLVDALEYTNPFFKKAYPGVLWFFSYPYALGLGDFICIYRISPGCRALCMLYGVCITVLMPRPCSNF